MLGKWLANLTWKQRYAEKSAECDELNRENEQLAVAYRKSERRQNLAEIAERIYLQRKVSRLETGGPMIKCALCATLVFGASQDICGLCELDQFLGEPADSDDKAAA